MATYLITGGSGFIGTHLCRALLQAGHQVIILDIRLSQLTHPHLRMVQGSVTDAAKVTALLTEVDGCFHLAAIASVVESAHNWVGAHEVNQTAVVILLNALRQLQRPAHACPVIFASSAAIYGNNTVLPLTEAMHGSPQSAYAIDKYASEWHADIAANLYGLPSISLRFFNVYGEGQDPNSPYSGIISIMKKKFQDKQALTIFGDGKQTRDFIHVSDVVQACLLSMKHLKSHIEHLTFNVCTGRQESLLDLLTIFSEIYGYQPPIEYAETRPGDVRYSCGDPSLAKHILGFEAQLRLQAGLSAWLAPS